MIIDMSVSMMYRRIAESCVRVIVRAAGYDEERVAASIFAGRIWPTAFLPPAIGHWISEEKPSWVYAFSPVASSLASASATRLKLNPSIMLSISAVMRSLQRLPIDPS